MMTVQMCPPPPCSIHWLCYFPPHMWLSGHDHCDSRDLPHSRGGTWGASTSRLCNKPSGHCSHVCRLVDGNYQHRSHYSWYCGASNCQSHCCRGMYVYICTLLVFMTMATVLLIICSTPKLLGNGKNWSSSIYKNVL